MKKNRNLFTQNQTGVSVVVETSVAATIVIVILTLFFTSLHNLYTPYERADVDLQAKIIDVCETLINGPGQNMQYGYNWEENPDSCMILGLAASPLVEYGTFQYTSGTISDITRYSPPETNMYTIERSCFLAGTQVLMGDGSTTPIEAVQSGDLVMSYHEAEHTRVQRKVTRVYHHPAEEMGAYYLCINGELKVTPHHRLFHNNRWITFDELTLGDTLSGITIFSIETIYEQAPTYNLEIEHDQTYFISFSKGLLPVHNADDSPEEIDIDELPWVLTGKNILPSDTSKPYGGEYYIEYTPELVAADTYVYEIKETNNYPYAVLDIQKINALLEIEYEDARQMLGFESIAYAVYDFTIEVKSQSGACDVIYRKAYGDENVLVSNTRSVIIYHPPELTASLTAPYFEPGTLTVQLFLGGTITNPPEQPEKPTHESGDTYIENSCTFQTSTIDSDGDTLEYRFDWDDWTVSDWTSGKYPSGDPCTLPHSWDEPGTYHIRVQARDAHGAMSPWSKPSEEIVITYGEHFKTITIDHNDIDDDLTNFPLLVYTDSEIILKNTRSEGEDIVFTDSEGTKLHHEIEKKNNEGLWAWVNVPTIKNNKDTELVMWYGNEKCSPQWNPEGTWDSHYVMVHHFNEDPSAGKGTGVLIHDATSYSNDGTAKNFEADDWQDGPLYKAIRINNDQEYVEIENHDSLYKTPDNQWSIEAWVKPENLFGTIIRKHDSTEGYFLRGSTSGRIGSFLYTGDISCTPPPLWEDDDPNSGQFEKNNWQYIAVTYNGEYRYHYQLYDNGAVIENIYSRQDAVDTEPGDNTGNLKFEENFVVSIGKRPKSDDGYWHGLLDEVRLSNVYRSESWIKASFDMVNDPDFLSWS
jgi:hypothetical protein